MGKSIGGKGKAKVQAAKEKSSIGGGSSSNVGDGATPVVVEVDDSPAKLTAAQKKRAQKKRAKERKIAEAEAAANGE